MERPRIPTHVKGFDEAVGGGLPEGYVVLVAGAPGTMKSSLAFSIAYNNALRDGRKGVYFTLEQSKDNLLEHMASMGMADEKALGLVTILDMGSIRKNLNFLQGRGTWFELFKMHCTNIMKADRQSILVVDSLDVLETMAKMADRRTDMYFLFEWLRDLGPLTLLVSERPGDATAGVTAAEEAYLADGIVQVAMQPTSDLQIQRRIRVVKLRSTRHETAVYALAWAPGGFEVTRAVS